MKASERVTPGGRETRLLFVTIVVSVGVLLLLSRFRFPVQAADAPATPAAAPFERLAARAAYDELASTMADLERRLTGPVAVLAVEPDRGTGGFVVAPRLTPDRAVTLLRPDEDLPGDATATSRILARDTNRDLAFVSVASDANGIVTARSGAPRPGPRYVVAVEASGDGLTLRPVYVGRTSVLQDEATSTPLLALSGIQYPIPRGAAIFSLEGIFIGLVTGGGATATVVPGDFLRGEAERATASAERPQGEIGVDVAPLTEVLTRVTGAAHGVIVNDVVVDGPSAGVLLPGDVIQTVGGKAVTTVAGFRAAEQGSVPDQPLTLLVVRRRAPEQLIVRPRHPETTPPPGADSGLALRTVPGHGIEVIAVDSSTPAARAGFQRGDLIVAIDGRAAGDAGAFSRTVRSASPGAAWVITIQRGVGRQNLALEKH